jgi:hypothetical protein
MKFAVNIMAMAVDPHLCFQLTYLFIMACLSFQVCAHKYPYVCVFVAAFEAVDGTLDEHSTIGDNNMTSYDLQIWEVPIRFFNKHYQKLGMNISL